MESAPTAIPSRRNAQPQLTAHASATLPAPAPPQQPSAPSASDGSVGVVVQYVTHLRKTFDAEWQRKYLDIPLTIAVDAISWHDMARAPQETMANITLPTVPQIRSMINDTLLDVLYYRSPVYGRRLISAVARLLNAKVALYKKTFPNFSGQVSLFCHSLGSVIMFDLLQKQGRKDGPGGEHWAGTNPGLTVSELEGGEGEWEWPQLNFKVENMFGLGSPVAMFLTTRGDIHQEDWKREATSFTFPGGAHFRNIFDPTDPVAFRFEPLINPHYSKFPPAVIPARNKRVVLGEATPATRADFYGWERIDYALQEGSETGLMGHVRAIAQAHYCYWFSKDLSMFIIHTLLNQKLYGHDSTQAVTSQQAEAAGPKAPRGQRLENPLRAAEAERHAQELLTLKEQVMWLITSDLLSFEVPAIVGSRVAGASGTFNYAIGNLRVSSIDVPRHKVVSLCVQSCACAVGLLHHPASVPLVLSAWRNLCRLIAMQVVVVFTRAGHVTIKITDASAQLRGFTWLYKQRGPPHLKVRNHVQGSCGGQRNLCNILTSAAVHTQDSGTADASISGDMPFFLC